jgi:hypothetical protein
MVPLHQSHFHTLLQNLFEQLLEQLRFLKPPMTILGKCRVMWDLLIEAQPREPAPSQVHAQFFLVRDKKSEQFVVIELKKNQTTR